MIIKIHQSLNTERVFYYNEEKVEKNEALFFAFANANCANPFMYEKAFRLNILTQIEDGNNRAKHKCFHLSINPASSDLDRIEPSSLKAEIDALMCKLGYGQQPYYVYRHQDIKREHYHVVSTRIDVNTRRQIKNSNDRYIIKDFIKELNLKYQLETAQSKKMALNLISSSKSAELKESIQQVFSLLNRSNIVSKQEYLDILKASNLEIYESANGQSVLVKDQEGVTLRHPINMSDFNEKAALEKVQFNKTELNLERQNALKSKTEQTIKGLIKNYRFYTEEELRKAFLKNDLILYKVTKNGNYNIYSPNDKMVVDAQFILKKYSVRLKDFALSNDQFYTIIREYTQDLKGKGQSIVDALIDKDKMNKTERNKKPNISFEKLDLSSSNEFSAIVSSHDEKAKKAIQNAVKAHFEYLFSKMDLEGVTTNTEKRYLTNQSGCWDKINRQFLLELTNYWRREEGRNKLKKQGKSHRFNKRKGRRL
ncbi:relaxase/mobilization nuclease domain-containing protein [Carboxylicivirga sp. N1Y90]|uniref:relaxase/mobilization nuclease domain-containing protein n=1 Tax=Carboxylicivirga fragile TaxID=3417571 RepID=UPI003D33382F|nr:relaxase/mobilization nuclease domain-containing protein [Marinilabiliaceae bacterium N1Y90]